ncbi:MAG TPA: CoA-binding protein [Chloroflexaceae bacterium]|nr:CoA-binding protein [Chloroflexaceae bacterium]
MDYQANLLSDYGAIQELLRRTRRVAVLGMRPERQDYKPAHYVPAALIEMGLEVIPVPVRDRDVTSILGRPVYHRVADVPGPVDLVDVFRRSADLPAHLDDLLAARPYAVWFQSGIRNDAVAEELARAGIKVVQSRCLMVDYRHFLHTHHAVRA